MSRKLCRRVYTCGVGHFIFTPKTIAQDDCPWPILSWPCESRHAWTLLSKAGRFRRGFVNVPAPCYRQGCSVGAIEKGNWKSLSQSKNRTLNLQAKCRTGNTGHVLKHRAKRQGGSPCSRRSSLFAEVDELKTSPVEPYEGLGVECPLGRLQSWVGSVSWQMRSVCYSHRTLLPQYAPGSSIVESPTTRRQF